MTTATIKKVVKSAVREGLRESREELRDMVGQIMEDIAMANAIHAGMKSKPVSRATVLRTLKAKQ